MTDYQDALVLENLELVNWVIRTRISIPNRPLLTYDDFYAIGCEAICRAALKYQPDMGAFAPFACRYIYNAIVDHCRAMNYRLERSVEISEDENASLLDIMTHDTIMSIMSQSAFSRSVETTWAIFYGKNFFGMSDRTEITVAPPANPLGDTTSPAELEQKYLTDVIGCEGTDADEN